MKLLFIFLLDVYGCFASMYGCTPGACTAHAVHGGASHASELELQTVVSSHVEARNQTLVFS